MYYTQNRKIMQVTETTLVVGVDIGSQWHYARAFDWREIELTRKVFRFSNDLDGYIAFEEWVQNVSAKSAKIRPSIMQITVCFIINIAYNIRTIALGNVQKPGKRN